MKALGTPTFLSFSTHVKQMKPKLLSFSLSKPKPNWEALFYHLGHPRPLPLSTRKYPIQRANCFPSSLFCPPKEPTLSSHFTRLFIAQGGVQRVCNGHHNSMALAWCKGYLDVETRGWPRHGLKLSHAWSISRRWWCQRLTWSN